jgi:glycosyltransferase involved in cell wall biosynthesis
VKCLLVSFYFPPAGGGGVQRPLKLAQYLPAMGVETHVLAPDDPRWMHRDDGLRAPSQAWVHRSRYVGVSGGKPSEVLAGTTGLERVATQARLQLRRLVVPDENATWALTAIPAGIRIVREHGIDVVVSTSPPPSTHLIAAAIARATGARWVADLRDSLVAHAHRRSDTAATKAKAATQRRVARLVASRADAITCVSDAISEETRALEPRGRVVTIANGCDFDDVAGLERHPSERFRITHTGSFFGRRDPRPFLQALHDSGLDVAARFLGDFRPADRAWAESLGLGERLELLPYAPRAESLALQRDSEALLLLIPEAEGRGRGVLSGKVFEYLAVGRPILAAVPPDGAAAELIRDTGAGLVVAPDDTDAIRGALAELNARRRADGLPDVALSEEWRARLSRRTRVEEMAALLHEVAES